MVSNDIFLEKFGYHNYRKKNTLSLSSCDCLIHISSVSSSLVKNLIISDFLPLPFYLSHSSLFKKVLDFGAFSTILTRNSLTIDLTLELVPLRNLQRLHPKFSCVINRALSFTCLSTLSNILLITSHFCRN